MTGRGIIEVALAQARRNRHGLGAWAIAMSAVCALYTGFWPAFDGDAIQAMTDSLPAGLTEALGYENIATPAGWLTSTIYGLLGPVLLLVFSVGFGARVVAGDERDGLLALELVQPLPRASIVLGRLVAGVLSLAALVVVVTTATLLTARIVGMTISGGQLVAGGVALFIFCLPWLALSWAVAALTGHRGATVGVAAGLAVTAYALHVVSSATGRSAWGSVSPFHWYVESDPLVRGVDPTLAIVTVVIASMVTLAGAISFGRRDVQNFF